MGQNVIYSFVEVCGLQCAVVLRNVCNMEMDLSLSPSSLSFVAILASSEA